MCRGSLGFKPDALNHRLTLMNPYLPTWLSHVRIKSLRIGDSLIGLEFQPKVHTTLVDIEKKRGDVKVTVEY